MKPLLFTSRLGIAIAITGGMLIAGPASAIGKPYNNLEKTKKDPSASKPVAKTLSSRNNNAVKIVPHMVKRGMHVVARESKSAEVDFYIFDLQGTLIRHDKMKEKDRLKIVGLQRGKYVYRVFDGDVESASGQFDIR